MATLKHYFSTEPTPIPKLQQRQNPHALSQPM